MLSPDYISNLPDQIVKYWQDVEDYIITDIGRRFNKMGEVTGTAEIQRLVTKNLGADLTDIDKKIAEALHKTQEEVTQLFNEAAAKNQSDYNWMSEKTGRPLDKSVISQITQSAISSAQGDLDNITATMGFVTRSGQFSLWDQAYRQALSLGSLQVASGATSYTQAAREIINEFAGKGMMIQYASGQRRTVETAVRMCITSGVGRMAKDMAEQNGQMLGADGVEISAHAGSAPDHEPYQGHQYKKAEFEAIDNMLDRPFEVLNCRHIVYPVILGITPPVYTQEQLSEMAAENVKGITFDGKHYTLYEATQMQRQIERAIRGLKRELIGAQSFKDQELFINKSIKLNVLRRKYESFSHAAGLPLQHERSQVYGFGRSISARAVAAAKLNLNPSNPPSGSGGSGGAQVFPVSGLQASAANSIINIPGSYGDTLRQRLMSGTKEAQALYKKTVPPQGAVSNSNYAGTAFYDPNSGAVKMNYKRDASNVRGAGSTWFHEHGHYIDDHLNRPSHSSYYEGLIKSDVKAYEAKIKAQYGYTRVNDVRQAISRELCNVGDTTAGIQDLYDSTLPTTYPGMKWGHSNAYWKTQWSRAHEAFANMFEASFDTNKVALMQKYLPNAWGEFNNIIGGLTKAP